MYMGTFESWARDTLKQDSVPFKIDIIDWLEDELKTINDIIISENRELQIPGLWTEDEDSNTSAAFSIAPSGRLLSIVLQEHE